MPILETVSVTLSPPVRVLALVGAIVVTGLAVFVFVVARGGTGNDAGTVAPAARKAAPSAKPATVRAATPAAKRAARPKAPARSVRSGYPAPIDHALRYSRVVVVVVYLPHARVDAVVRREARAAATSSRAGFVALNALNERLVGGLVSKTGVLPAPAVVVVRRPGIVSATFGVTDRETVEQAVALARR